MKWLFVGMNLAGALALGMVYISIRSTSSRRFVDQRLFRYLLLAVIANLIGDVVTVSLDGLSYPHAHLILQLATAAFYITCPLPSLLWVVYSDYKLLMDMSGLKRRLRWYLLPFLVYVTMTVLSPWTGWFFIIDAENVYRRGALVGFSWGMALLYMPMAYSLIRRAKKPVSVDERELRQYIWLFPLPPMVGMLLQATTRLVLLGTGYVVSVLMIFINVQHRLVHIDGLTGAMKRRSFEVYLDNLLAGGRSAYIVMVDIDDLKRINDTRGSAAGDAVLLEVYSVLVKCSADGTAARLGGDEFAIAGPSHEPGDAGRTREKVAAALSEWREKAQVSVTLSIAEGGGTTGDALITQADSQLFQTKDQRRRELAENLARVAEYERLLTQASRGLYESIYELDLTHNCAGGQSTREYFERLGIPGDTSMTEALQQIARQQIKPEYRQGYLDTFLPDAALAAFRSGKGSLSYDFPITKNGGESYYWMRITARIFYWAMDQSVRMITFRQNIEAEKQRELAPLQKAQRLEEELAQSRIAIMLSQIQPHFIYNTLVVISHLCDIDPAQAKQAVLEFSRYLRGNLDALTCHTLISFEAEMEHTRNYLAIEQKRFGERVKIETDLRATGFMLPALTLQPVVENAVRHGITKQMHGGTVWIETRDGDGYVEILVRDDGVGFDTAARREEDGRTHVGLENVRQRLAAMRGGTLQVESAIGQGTSVRITLPQNQGVQRAAPSGPRRAS